MPDIGGALSIGGSLLGGIFGGDEESSAASDASAAQVQASREQIAEMRRQFDAVQKLLSPFVQAGTGAVGAQQALLGLQGGQAQQEAINALQRSPAFTSALQQGEASLRANASATGGLRGGNIQAALAQFSPQLLAKVIDAQFQNLGTLSSMGQNAAAGVGNAGVRTGENVSSALGNIGAAQAGNALAQGGIRSNMIGSIAGGLGQVLGQWNQPTISGPSVGVFGDTGQSYGFGGFGSLF